MKKNKVQDCYLVLPPTKTTTIEEKAQYIKDNMHLLVMPIPTRKIDEMLLLIKTDWKGVGGECHEWIEECYNNLKEFNKNNNE